MSEARDKLLEDLIAYYDFDEQGDDPILDRSDFARHLEWQDDPNLANFSRVSGIINQAGRWSGPQAQAERQDEADIYKFAGIGFKAAFWLRLDDTSSGSIFRCGQSSTLWNIRGDVSSGTIVIGWRRAGFSGSYTSLSTSITSYSGWTHFVLDYDPSIPDHGQFRIRINGSIVASSPSSSGTNNTLIDERAGPFFSLSSSDSDYLKQPLDEFYFGYGPATDDESEWLYNDGEGRSWNDFVPPPTEEEVFRATFADATGRDPFPSALLQRTPARKLANHYVNLYRFPPYRVTKRFHIRFGERHLTEPGRMIWHQDPDDPLFKMGRWAQIQGAEGDARAGEVELVLRISDHPESFIPPPEAS